MTLEYDLDRQFTIKRTAGDKPNLPASFQINGVAVTATAAEINAIAGGGLSAAELGFLDGATAGTAVASKALVVGTNKNVDVFVVADGGFALGSGAGTAVTSTAAELNLIDGSVVGNSVASKAAMLDSGKLLRTNANVGTANTGTTAVEYGDGRSHTTVLTVSTTLLAIAGGANLAVGKLLYTLPAGAQIIESAYMSLAITQTQGNINADTPDGGLGTVIATGAVATLDGTPTFEDIITGQTFANCTGTAKVKTSIPTAAVPFVTEAAGSKAIHFNVADGWAASGDAAATLVGTVTLHWKHMS